MQLATREGNWELRARSAPTTGMDARRYVATGAGSIAASRLPTGQNLYLALNRIYRTNPVVYACVHSIARGLSTLPLKTYQHLPDGQRKRIRSDVPQGPGRPSAGIALDQLVRKPAPGVSRRHLIFRSAVDMGIFGNGLLNWNWGPNGPQEIWPIPWRRVQIDTDGPDDVLMFRLLGSQGIKNLLPEESIHLTWADDPESPAGVSPIEACQYTIALHNAIDRHLTSYYGNAARPSGILHVEQMPGDKEVEKIREQFRQLYTSPENAGNVLITRAQFQPIAESTGVPTLVELVKLSREEICGAYGVPPPMIGVLERAIKANVAELREQYVRDVLGPWAVLYEAEFQAQMVDRVPTWSYYFLEFDLDSRLRPSLEQRANAYQAMQGTFTPNERRLMENLPTIDVPEANVPWMGSGTIPMGIGTPTTVADNTPEAPGAGPPIQGEPAGVGDPGDDDADDPAEG